MIGKKRNNMIFEAFFVTFTLVLTSFSIFASAETQKDDGTVILTYSFESPTIAKIEIGDISYDQVVIQGLSNSGSSGEPNLPSKGAYILLPQGMDVADITITTTEKICLGEGFFVEPVGEIIPISDINKEPLSSPNKDIYNSNEEFPGSIFTEVGTYNHRGYKILILKLNPIQYIPVTGELFFYENIEVSVCLKEKRTIHSLFRDLEKDRIEVENRVDNPKITETYTQPVNHLLTDYDLLIITTDALKDGFEPLKTTHDANGISTIIKTTSDIGSSNPDDIRDYITAAYTNWAIDYVLIGADDDIIPAKDLYVRTIWWWPWSETEEHMPSDIYFACLDGTYNYDGDGYWGEPGDGPGGGDVDLVAEVYVGRAPVGTTSEVDNFVSKTIAYMYSQDSYLDDVLMVGEFLDFGGAGDWGGNYMDELIDGSSAHGYTTVGVPSAQYNIDTLYDRDWAGNDWPKSEMINRINNNLHLINHLGHCNYNYAMKLSSGDVSSLINDKFCFVYSQGCMAGGFDNGDCIAEYFTVKTDNAAFAVVMNARYGWGSSTTDGPSQRFHREYIDAVFGEGKTTLGRANHDSKEDNLYRINDDCMRWCYYQLNLFGDPTIDFLNHISNVPPDTPDTPSGETSGSSGTEYTYTTNTDDYNGDQVFYKWDWGDGFSDWIGPYDSGEEIETSHTWDAQGNYEIKVKAKDVNGAESDWSNPLEVSMPKNKDISVFFNFLERFFPNIFSFFNSFLLLSK